MALSPERFGTRIGILKILTIVFGIITLGFIGYSHYSDGRDKAFLACTIICFIVSFLWALAVILNVIHDSEGLKKADMLYHMVAFLFYVITLICFIVSLIDHRTGNNRMSDKLWQRIFSFIFGVVTSFAYGYTGFLLYHSME